MSSTATPTTVPSDSNCFSNFFMPRWKSLTSMQKKLVYVLLVCVVFYVIYKYSDNITYFFCDAKYGVVPRSMNVVHKTGNAVYSATSSTPYSATSV